LRWESDGAEFLRFLRKAVKPHAGKEIHVALDNLPAHDTPDVQAWVGPQPQRRLPLHPGGSSRLIETWFGIATRQAVRRGTFASVNALIDRIRRYVQHWNTDAQPFVWTATADEILAKVRCVERNVKQLKQHKQGHVTLVQSGHPPATESCLVFGWQQKLRRVFVHVATRRQ
jgi:hypothetical protein